MAALESSLPPTVEKRTCRQADARLYRKVQMTMPRPGHAKSELSMGVRQRYELSAYAKLIGNAPASRIGMRFHTSMRAPAPSSQALPASRCDPIRVRAVFSGSCSPTDAVEVFAFAFKGAGQGYLVVDDFALR